MLHLYCGSPLVLLLSKQLLWIRLNKDIQTYNEGAPNRGPLQIRMIDAYDTDKQRTSAQQRYHRPDSAALEAKQNRLMTRAECKPCQVAALSDVGLTHGVKYSLWRWGLTYLFKHVSHETPDVTPCRASLPMPFVYTRLARNARCNTMPHLTAAGCINTIRNYELWTSTTTTTTTTTTTNHIVSVIIIIIIVIIIIIITHIMIMMNMNMIMIMTTIMIMIMTIMITHSNLHHSR